MAYVFTIATPMTNEETFSAAYTSYVKALSRRAKYKISNADRADELVQDTFLKIWVHIIGQKKIDSMKSLLFYILNHLIIDEYRKKKPVSLEKLAEKGFEVWTDDSEHLFNKIDAGFVVLLMPKMTEKYRRVVTLRYIDDQSIQEIAKLTGQSKKTVAVQIHRGLEQLAVLFKVEKEKRRRIKRKSH